MTLSLIFHISASLYRIYVNFLCFFLGDELEYVGGLGGNRYGYGGMARKASIGSNHTQALGSEVDDNEEMEIS